MPRRELNDLAAMRIGDTVRHHDQAAVRLARSRSNGTLNFGAIGNARDRHIHSQSRGGSLDGMRNANLTGLSRIENYRDATYSGRKFLEYLQLFPADRIFASGKPSDVAARTRQARDNAVCDRVRE